MAENNFTFKEAKLYANATDVSEIAADLLCDFEGDVDFDVAEEYILWSGQSIADKGSDVIHKTAKMVIHGVTLDLPSLATLKGITSESDFLRNAAGTDVATLYPMKSTDAVPELEFLIAGTYNELTLQMFGEGKAYNVPFSMGKSNWVTFDLEIILQADATTGTFLTAIYEDAP